MELKPSLVFLSSMLPFTLCNAQRNLPPRQLFTPFLPSRRHEMQHLPSATDLPRASQDAGRTPFIIVISVGVLVLAVMVGYWLTRELGLCMERIEERRMQSNPSSDLVSASAGSVPASSVPESISSEPALPTSETSSVDLECAICLCGCPLGDDHSRTLPCGHIFHQACIDKWLSKSRTCPSCRHSVDHMV